MTNLPQGWEVKTLEEIFNIERGGSPRPIKEFLTDKEDGINWIKIGDIKNQKYLYTTEEKIIQEGLKKSKLVIEGDLLISNSMSFGKPVIVKLQKGAIHDGWLLLREKINLSKEYFYYLFSSNFMYNFLSHQASGSTVKNLNIDKFKQIKIPLPPLKEQERIVGILDFAFSKIDENIKKAKENLANIDELMQSALQKAFNPLNDDTKENYQLPQSWEWKSLGEIGNTSSGGTPLRNKKEYWENGSIKWLKSGELNDGYIDFIEENITEEAIENSSAKIFQKGTLLIAMYGATAGRLGILNLDSATNQAVCAFLHKDNKNIKFLEKFLFYFLFFIRDKIIKDSFGGAQPNISQTYIKNLQIPLPPLQEQEQIAKHLDFVFEKAKALKELYTKELKDYEELKQSLLDKAFKGEL
ncbi:type I restriction endonuclease [Campylobacter jejuni subsp. jejuni]|uniref:restriction endonuclease subunit S n=1 Tax=Campylobacter jejuni TaxID=197 RepID=UPI000C285056|nr:restriction endonuclease subunit S [Campylobacter jejuni]EAL0412413.1 restriction endonuclease subunit S [Campylobacter jejuni]PJP45373.1 type I restriction endonuclease [Campylobacter jejuni subsp. jejuni]PJQ65420.1 type I restriction endonuclease [Campylobacter jejuni subsp. jejuni]PJQ66055.1 type I restriction endonuclease [Campylobacter jejuni subsp. jejuni]PJQ69044.1 type I restriction endonuclease [Campylobacter jejuni subsp. jejuni]